MERTTLLTGLRMERESSFGCVVLYYSYVVSRGWRDAASDDKIVSGPRLAASEAG
jgi:hypothetical protein